MLIQLLSSDPDPPSSQMPLVIFSNLVIVMSRENGTRGNHRDSRSLSLSLPRSTSSRITVAVNVLVMLPIRNSLLGVILAPGAATPNAR